MAREDEVGRRLTSARQAMRDAEPPLICRLAEVRTSAGLTQPELAERSGVSRETISLIERGKLEPGVRVAIKLSGALGVPSDSLFTLQSAPVAPPSRRGVLFVEWGDGDVLEQELAMSQLLELLRKILDGARRTMITRIELTELRD